MQQRRALAKLARKVGVALTRLSVDADPRQFNIVKAKLEGMLSDERAPLTAEYRTLAAEMLGVLNTEAEVIALVIAKYPEGAAQ